ncbi:MAG TPA: glycosyltransferase family 4 protein [Luteitalea sp.]|nr:glycosyltransferase family 4 protein [Luteitalea sp.]
MRIAWFSPLPPVHSGIAAYSVDVLEGLRAAHQVHLFVEDRVWDAAGGHLHAGLGPLLVPLAGPHGLPLYRAHDFVVRHDQAPYDLVVYQMGNAACHRFMWPYLLRWPGMVVLHDAALHHARAQALLTDERADDYRAEFRFNHPGVDPRVADYVVAGLQGSPYYLWPMLRTVMARARAVVVHSAPLQEALTDEFPETPVATVSMGVPDPWGSPGTGNLEPGTGQTLLGTVHGTQGTGRPHTVRGKAQPGTGYRVPGTPQMDEGSGTTSGVTLSAFGVITPEKRLLPVLRALAALRNDLPGVRLRLVGEIGEHYALWEDVRRTGTRDLIEVTGYVDDETLAEELRRADVCLCLRWPTAHETSASWLRCLAAGKPTVIADQLSTVNVPTLDPRHWQLKHTRDDAAAVLQPPDPSSAVAVSVEIADEEAMVRQALRRLSTDAHLRATLGQRAREWWEARHTLPRMHRDYVRAVAWAATRPVPGWPADAPPHLRPDPRAAARDLLRDFGVPVDLLEPR